MVGLPPPPSPTAPPPPHLAPHVVDGRVGRHVGVVGCAVRVAPLLPLRHSEGDARVRHRRQHVHEGHLQGRGEPRESSSNRSTCSAAAGAYVQNSVTSLQRPPPSRPSPPLLERPPHLCECRGPQVGPLVHDDADEQPARARAAAGDAATRSPARGCPGRGGEGPVAGCATRLTFLLPPLPPPRTNEVLRAVYEVVERVALRE